MRKVNLIRASNVMVEGIAVIEGVIHRVSNRFVVCNPALNRMAWGITEPRRVCYRCFPLEEDRAPFNEIIENRAQIDLFKECNE